MILHRQLAIGRLQHLVVGGAVDFQQFVIIDVERHSSKPLLQPVTPAKAGAAVGPVAPVPRAMPACAGMTAEGPPYFLSSSTSENSASTTSSSALLSPASAAGEDRKSTRLNSSH